MDVANYLRELTTNTQVTTQRRRSVQLSCRIVWRWVVDGCHPFLVAYFSDPTAHSSTLPSMALIVLSPRKHHRIDVRPIPTASSRVFTPLICHKTVRVHWQTSGRNSVGCGMLDVVVLNQYKCIGFKLNQCPLAAFFSIPFHSIPASRVVKLLSSRQRHLLSSRTEISHHVAARNNFRGRFEN